MGQAIRIVAAVALLWQVMGMSAWAAQDDFEAKLASAPRRVASTAQPDAVAPGRVVVRLTDAAYAAGDWHADFEARGWRVLPEAREVMDAVGIVQLHVEPGAEAEVAASLNLDPRVAWAEPDPILKFELTPNDRYFARWQWYSRQTGAEAAWDVTTGVDDVVVAVVDTGIDAKHPEFKNRLVEGYSFLGSSRDTQDQVGHGTSVAGLIGAEGNNRIGIAGLAWRVKLMPLRIGNEDGARSTDAARAIRYAADRGVKIVNLSLGSTRQSRTLEEAIDYAHSKGVLMVAAMGNEFEEGNPVIYPAANPKVLAVGSSTADDRRSHFSNTGSHVKLVAPGGDARSSRDRDPEKWIYSTDFDPETGESEYSGGVGTSLSVPQVSGLAALLLAVNPALTNVDLERIMTETADRIGGRDRTDEFGYGRINIGRAVRAAGATPRPIQYGIDTPLHGSTLTGQIAISGWAADLGNKSGPGIVSVSIYANAPPPNGVLLGQAQLGRPRQDVVNVTKQPTTLNSGFSFAYDSSKLPDGPTELFVVMQPVGGEPVITQITVQVANGRPGPVASGGQPAVQTSEGGQISLDSVQPGQTVRGVVPLVGWSADPASRDGAGITGVQIFVDGPAGEGRPLPPAQYGLPRADVAAALANPAIANCGFQVSWDTAGLPPGPHRLYLYAIKANGAILGPTIVPVTVGG